MKSHVTYDLDILRILVAKVVLLFWLHGRVSDFKSGGHEFKSECYNPNSSVRDLIRAGATGAFAPAEIWQQVQPVLKMTFGAKNHNLEKNYKFQMNVADEFINNNELKKS